MLGWSRMSCTEGSLPWVAAKSRSQVLISARTRARDMGAWEQRGFVSYCHGLACHADAPVQGPSGARYSRRPRLLPRPPRPPPLFPRQCPLLQGPPSKAPLCPRSTTRPRRAPFPLLLSVFRFRFPLFPCHIISHLSLPIARPVPSSFSPRLPSRHTTQAHLETSTAPPCPPRARNSTKTAYPNEASFETSPDQYSPQIKDESLRPSPYHSSQSRPYRRVGRDRPIRRQLPS